MKTYINKQKIDNSMGRGKDLSKKEINKIREYKLKGFEIKKISKLVNRGNRTIYTYTKDIKENLDKEDLENFKANLNKISPFDLGYLCGIMDGEGCLSIGEHKNTPTKPHFFAILDITNSNKKIIDYINKILPTNCLNLRKDKRKKYKDVWNYRIYNSKKIELILNYIKDKLVGKGEQAKNILEFLKQNKDDKKREYHLINKNLNKNGC